VYLVDCEATLGGIQKYSLLTKLEKQQIEFTNQRLADEAKFYKEAKQFQQLDPKPKPRTKEEPRTKPNPTPLVRS